MSAGSACRLMGAEIHNRGQRNEHARRGSAGAGHQAGTAGTGGDGLPGRGDGVLRMGGFRGRRRLPPSGGAAALGPEDPHGRAERGRLPAERSLPLARSGDRWADRSPHGPADRGALRVPVRDALRRPVLPLPDGGRPARGLQHPGRPGRIPPRGPGRMAADRAGPQRLLHLARRRHHDPGLRAARARVDAVRVRSGGRADRLHPPGLRADSPHPAGFGRHGPGPAGVHLRVQGIRPPPDPRPPLRRARRHHVRGAPPGTGRRSGKSTRRRWTPSARRPPAPPPEADPFRGSRFARDPAHFLLRIAHRFAPSG